METEEESRAKLDNDASIKWLRLHMETEEERKGKTGEDGSYRTGHVSPDQWCGRCGCGFVP